MSSRKEGRRIDNQVKARILELKFKRSGYPREVEYQARRTSTQVTKLKRLKAAKAKTIEYPPIPIYVLSKTRLKMPQRDQNRAPRQAYSLTTLHTHRDLPQKSKTQPNKSEINPQGK